mmetsp:Transcript_10868/g.16217  ORF Transcript_10868/g.16217 Transcript_10868/m.16217 type:complete len:660 (+) Transcript_10868:208-2187(+)
MQAIIRNARTTATSPRITRAQLPTNISFSTTMQIIGQSKVLSFATKNEKILNHPILGYHSSRRFLASSAAEPAAVRNQNASNTSENKSASATQAGIAAPVRLRISEVAISEVLKAKHTLKWVEPVICSVSSLRDAITTCIDCGLSGMMVVDRDNTISDNTRERGKVLGMITSRDLLRIAAKGFKDGMGAEAVMDQQIKNFMTPLNQVIYARPEETIGQCRTVMSKLGIKCMPVLSNGRVDGIVTQRDLSDFGLEATDRGGKKSFLRNVSERVGLSSNTSMAEPPIYMQAHLALEQKPLYANVGVACLPHPFKTEDGIGMNHRDFGPHEFCMDNSLSEDAYFSTKVRLPDEASGKKKDMVYMGVADGVGSWRQYGVDPRDFSHLLMKECRNILLEAAADARRGGDNIFNRAVTPSEIMSQAYERVKAEGIIGSSTACIALFDGVRHQLHFSNLGDSGIIVLRHIDSDVAGALKRNRKVPRSERTSDLRVAFVSQQQLVSFNHPYQLGWTGEELEDNSDSGSLKTAADSCASSVHVRRGDIIIMATDGLFDNVDIDEIVEIALEWEEENGLINSGDIAARERRWAQGDSKTIISQKNVGNLADKLCHRARNNSIDQYRDSPFAILAKENDIMWSGGMPDDCTVVISHVVGMPSADDVPETI